MRCFLVCACISFLSIIESVCHVYFCKSSDFYCRESEKQKVAHVCLFVCCCFFGWGGGGGVKETKEIYILPKNK